MLWLDIHALRYFSCNFAEKFNQDRRGNMYSSEETVIRSTHKKCIFMFSSCWNKYTKSVILEVSKAIKFATLNFLLQGIF